MYTEMVVYIYQRSPTRRPKALAAEPSTGTASRPKSHACRRYNPRGGDSEPHAILVGQIRPWIFQTRPWIFQKSE